MGVESPDVPVLHRMPGVPQLLRHALQHALDRGMDADHAVVEQESDLERSCQHRAVLVFAPREVQALGIEARLLVSLNVIASA